MGEWAGAASEIALSRFLKQAAALLALALLAGCSDRADEASVANAGAGGDLEAAAIAVGVIPDPASTDPTGLYARATDRICVLPAPQDFIIGIDMDYGDGQHCTASGTARREGELLRVTLAGNEGCGFDARFEGDRIVLPGTLPKGCAHYCTGRASLAGMEADRLSDSAAEARAMRDAKGRLLCGG
ncbi:hypothetical protein [Hephaestia caeni]|uniref:hypothetical protein n=1 Tax=Hephaestia caeni TaxID=645617 RepID=UPI001FE5A96D|nr:hypothetical protein [Hephaestia caeni]